MNAYSDKPRISGASEHGDVTIRLSNISKFYSGVPALHDVSVEFYSGEVHAILGENGAGKSTLMNIISGAVAPEMGEIRVGDRLISRMSPEVAASLGIAISFQHPAILDDLSVLENLQVALPASVFAGRSAQIAAGEMLDSVGLHVPLRMRADALTVAQKHLLEIAKALAIKPRVLMLDEPTASLDQDFDRDAFRAHPGCRQDRNVGDLHHPQACRASPDRSPRHGASRRKGSGRRTGRRDLGCGTLEHDRRTGARIGLPAEA